MQIRQYRNPQVARSGGPTGQHEIIFSGGQRRGFPPEAPTSQGHQQASEENPSTASVPSPDLHGRLRHRPHLRMVTVWEGCTCR